MSGILNFNVISNDALNSLVNFFFENSIYEELDIEGSDDFIKITDNEQVIVINKHSPSEQIWLASPINGSIRFSYNENIGKWYTSKGVELFEFVKDEIYKVFGVG